jgi:hypothetical protein
MRRSIANANVQFYKLSGVKVLYKTCGIIILRLRKGFRHYVVSSGLYSAARLGHFPAGICLQQ